MGIINFKQGVFGLRIKKLQLKPEQNDFSLAVFHNNRWIVLKRLLEMFPGETDDACIRLADSSDDLIAFLRNRPELQDKLFSLLEKADLNACCQTVEMTEIMPFRPLHYRDFMLCERHVINSSRGIVKYTMPRLMPFVKAFEAMSRRPFPAFRPKRAWYDNPVYYKGNVTSFVGDGATIMFPRYATLKDYELELGMIITKDILNATEEEGLSAIGAFCVFNDFSARNVQYAEMRQTGFGPCKAKDFASAVSNVVVTADEILPYLDMLKTRVFINDRLVAEGRINELYHSLGKAVAYASRGERVYAGEFMATGTIPNCCGMENGHLLNGGDVIHLEIDRVGQLTNTISRDLL